MNIALFNEVTTEQALSEIEQETEHDIGIWADVTNAKERKYIKEQASMIKGISKEIEAARISISKKQVALVNTQAAEIQARLAKANEPYIVLLDEYAANRKVELAVEARRKADIEAAINKENDHEYAILLDKSHLADKLAAEKAQAEYEESIRYEAKIRAEEAVRASLAYDAEVEKRNDAARVADKNNVRTINRAIYQGFIGAGLTEDCAKMATQALIDSKINHTTINY